MTHATEMIRFDNVTKEFGDVRAVDQVSFSVHRGEFVALLGPSGAGKTTLLRMLAGFERPTEGSIILDDENITYLPPHKRDTGMVFQNYALFPHMTVRENIAFGLKRKGFGSQKIDERISEVLEMVDLPGFEERSPSSLSGGQQQRVATARALAFEPKVLLMDEPLGALDKKLRDQLQVEITELQQELDITTLYVTHNQEEALTMADRIVVVNEGQIEQIASPAELYNEPETGFVADFIGDTNFIDGTVSTAGTDSEGVVLETNGHRLDVASDTAPDDAVAFVRPEKISIRDPEYSDSENAVRGEVEQSIFMGSKTRYYVSALGSEFMVEVQNSGDRRQYESGDGVALAWDEDDTRIVAD